MIVEKIVLKTRLEDQVQFMLDTARDVKRNEVLSEKTQWRIDIIIGHLEALKEQ